MIRARTRLGGPSRAKLPSVRGFGWGCLEADPAPLSRSPARRMRWAPSERALHMQAKPLKVLGSFGQHLGGIVCFETDIMSATA